MKTNENIVTMTVTELEQLIADFIKERIEFKIEGDRLIEILKSKSA